MSKSKLEGEPRILKEIMEKCSCGKIFDETELYFKDNKINVLTKDSGKVVLILLEIDYNKFSGERVTINPDKIKDFLNKKFNYSENVVITNTKIFDADKPQTNRTFEPISLEKTFEDKIDGWNTHYDNLEEPKTKMILDSTEIQKIRNDDIGIDWVCLNFSNDPHSFSGGVGEDKEKSSTSLNVDSFEGEETNIYLSTKYLSILSVLSGEIELKVSKIGDIPILLVNNKDDIYNMKLVWVCLESPQKASAAKKGG